MTDSLIRTLYEHQFKCRYRGRAIVKNPFDFMLYAMLLTEYEPDLIIEIGTHEGGSARYFQDLLPWQTTSVHTIDPRKCDPVGGGVLHFECGWEDYKTQYASGFNRVVVIDDGSHRYEDVLGAFRKFSPLVPVGGYYIVEDGIIEELGESEQFNGGPLRAIREFLPGSGFEVCERWQSFFPVSFNTMGYLQRVR